MVDGELSKLRGSLTASSAELPTIRRVNPFPLVRTDCTASAISAWDVKVSHRFKLWITWGWSRNDDGRCRQAVHTISWCHNKAPSRPTATEIYRIKIGIQLYYTLGCSATFNAVIRARCAIKCNNFVTSSHTTLKCFETEQIRKNDNKISMKRMLY